MIPYDTIFPVTIAKFYVSGLLTRVFFSRKTWLRNRVTPAQTQFPYKRKPLLHHILGTRVPKTKPRKLDIGHFPPRVYGVVQTVSESKRARGLRRIKRIAKDDNCRIMVLLT